MPNLQVEKVDYLARARETSAAHRRSARIAALGGNVRDADAALVRGNHIYEASEWLSALTSSSFSNSCSHTQHSNVQIREVNRLNDQQ